MVCVEFGYKLKASAGYKTGIGNTALIPSALTMHWIVSPFFVLHYNKNCIIDHAFQ